MPIGSVKAATPNGVLPNSLSKQFVRVEAFDVEENIYADGSSQRMTRISLARRRWQLSKRLTPAQLQELRVFYANMQGPLKTFYFYDPWFTAPRFKYDQSGADATGRYAVRFESTQWAEDFDLGRYAAAVNLVEVA